MRPRKLKNNNTLYKIASGQGGYFTAQQAKTAGYYSRLQHYHKEQGHWLAIDRGVFRLRHFPHSDWEDLIHWFLWSRNKRGRPQAVVSHQTAATFHQLADFLSPKIHMTVPVGFRRQRPEGLILHKGALGTEDVESHEGFQVTTPFRTLQDLQSVHAEPDQVQLAIKDAAKRGLIRRDQRDQLLSADKLR